jgi:putative ABC transport system permease protein
VGWSTMALRRLRDAPVAAVGIALLVLATAFLFALAPRLLDKVATDALQGEIERASTADRGIQLVQERRIVVTGTGAMDGVAELGRRLEAQVPASVRDLISDRAFIVDTPRWLATSAVKPLTNITMRFEPAAAGRLRYVGGRPPAASTGTTTAPATAADPGGATVVFEAAMSTATADTLGVHLGDEILLTLDPTDRLAGNRRARAAVRIVGLYTVDDPASAFWMGDTILERPGLRALNADTVLFDAAVLLAPDAYAPLMALTDDIQVPMRDTWRYVIDPTRLTARNADAVVADLRRMQGIFRSPVGDVGGDAAILRTGLLRIVETQRTRWHAAEVVLAVAAIGPAVVAGAALALVGALAARRRRPTLAAWRGRGASLAQLVGSIALEGAILAIPAAIMGALIAAALVPVPDPVGSALLAGVVAVVAIVLLVLASDVRRVGVPGVGEREAGVRRAVSGRRLLFEALIVAAAVGGAFLLRERGVRGASSTGSLAGPDPLIALVPALVGIAAGIVAIRVLPIPLRAIAGILAAGRDLVPVLALRRATRDRSASAILLVLLTASTLAAFASASILQLSRSAELVAWRETGAAYRVSSDRALPTALDPSTLPGVTGSAGGYRGDASLTSHGGNATLLAVDATKYEAVIAGTPISDALPPEVVLAPGAVAPTDGIPVAISEDLATGPGALAIGDVVQISTGTVGARVRIVRILSSFPALADAPRFIVADRAAFTAVDPAADLPTTDLFLRGDPRDAGGLLATIATEAPDAVAVSAAARTAAIRADPVISAVWFGLAAAALATAAYAALAVGSALVLAGSARASETAHLRAIGLGRGAAVGLLVAEFGPIVAIAFIAGGALGLGLFVALQGGLGLAALVGSPADLPLAIDPLPLGLIMLGALAVVALGLGIAAFIQSRTVPALALREGMSA